ncbi:MAG TPA: DUF2127 domain-containing protein [Candidatus Paceibacterota bacterium]|nr:DUF2127 domain-containing protein [Candidatus Paceibacterota bacterium]
MEQMLPPTATTEERTVYDFFRVVVFLKGAQGIFELFAGLIVALIPLRAIVALADHFTEGELATDPDDFIATHLHDYAHALSISSKEFAAIYLLLHGIVKLGLALGLLSGKRWAYPAALGVLGLLILYQVYRIWLHHSLLLTGGTLFDCVVFYLIAREYLIVETEGSAAPRAAHD